MKKIALFCAVAGVALGAIAGFDGTTKYKFSSSGDTYANGDAVEDGEVYALIWVADGAAFSGFNADGTLVDAENNDLEAVSVAQGGGCMPTVFIVNDKERKGACYLYLLDTRVTVADAEGKVSKVVTGLNKDGKITVVNEALPVLDVNFDLASAETFSVDGATVVPVAATVDESKVDQPVVTKFMLANGGAVLTVSGTVPYVQYTVYGGTSVTGIDKTKPLATFLNGSVGGTLVLKVANVGDNRFFKVSTK